MNRLVFVTFLFLLSTTALVAESPDGLKAGASWIDITPQRFPVVVNGGFFPQIVETVQDPLYARCLMLQNGKDPIVFVVVDTCLIPFPLVERMKQAVTEKTGVPKDRLMISSTHCHSAPSLWAGHSSPVEESYLPLLVEKVAEAVEVAQKNLAPAKVGWAVGNDPNNVYCRRFLMKKGTAMINPFGGTSDDRAMMNPGHDNPNKIARTGPVDTAVTVLSVMTPDGTPIALLGNYSTHYAGVQAGVLSGDYFGVFAAEVRKRIAEKVGRDKMSEKFVGIMSNGTSGDANCIDFLNPKRVFDYQSVGRDTAEAAMAVWPNIEYFDRIPVEMAEKRLTLANRVPTANEVEAAKKHVAALPDGKPATIADVYALNTVEMEHWPQTCEVIVQAMRIGELGVTALPAEVYGITGLEIKARSPFRPTFNIGLANGCYGYIPTPEQHALGGYNTWRTAGSCLEVDAEPKIKATALELLETLHQH